MSISDDLLCLFKGEVSGENDSYVIEVPSSEVDVGDVEAGSVFRVAVLSQTDQTASRAVQGPEQVPEHDHGHSGPPVEDSETVDVEIEDIGEQGDGIARVGPGYVVIVPETERGERVTVEITDVRPNMAFAEVVDRYDSM